MKPLLYPQPRDFQIFDGYFELPCEFVFLFEYKGDAQKYDMIRLFCDRYRQTYGCAFYPVPDYAGKLDISVRMQSDSALQGEHYKFTIDERGVQLFYGTCAGAFRALTTFFQLLKTCNGRLPFCTVDDYPDIENRGYLYDISRDRVPKLQEIFRMIDILADLKYNELQLYLEQPAFEFAAYPQYAKDIEALTPDDLLQIVAYCKRRYIKVIPNQNSFGHIHLWMIKPELKHLSALPDGYAVNPLQEDTYQFLDNLYNSLLPCFDSDIFNVGCDEVSELNREGSHTKAVCEADGGPDKLYLKHVLRLHQMLADRHLTMMMWADIITNHPDLLSSLPKDIIPLVWGYEYDTDLHSQAKAVADAGFAFYVCPGTSSWASVLSDLENARKNIENAADACRQFGAKGILLTDWGDVGNACFPILSYQSIAWCAAQAWCGDANTNYQAAGEYIDNSVFQTQNVSFSKLIYKASTLIPKYCNCSDPVFSLLLDIDDYSVTERIPLDKIEQTFADIRNIEKQVRCIRMACSDAKQHIDEFCADVQAYEILLEMLEYKYELKLKGYLPDDEARLSALEQKIRDSKVFYRRVWANRWRITGWYGFWWFVDRQIHKFKRYLTNNSAYDILINDNKELGI